VKRQENVSAARPESFRDLRRGDKNIRVILEMLNEAPQHLNGNFLLRIHDPGARLFEIEKYAMEKKAEQYSVFAPKCQRGLRDQSIDGEQKRSNSSVHSRFVGCYSVKESSLPILLSSHSGLPRCRESAQNSG